MKLILLTVTHDRPLCFSLLERWIARQTRKPDEWVVVNDSTEPDAYKYTQGQTVIVRQDSDRSETNHLPSICKNILAACDYLKQKEEDFYCLICEDDDWYSSDYIDMMAEGLEAGELAGLTRSIYYQLPNRRWLAVGNTRNAPLAATGFRRSLLPAVSEIIQTYRSVWIDTHLWSLPNCSAMLLPQPHQGHYLHVGMKDMPGAAGLGAGHSDSSSSFVGWHQDDEELSKLVELVGTDAAEVYRGLLSGFSELP